MHLKRVGGKDDILSFLFDFECYNANFFKTTEIHVNLLSSQLQNPVINSTFMDSFLPCNITITLCTFIYRIPATRYIFLIQMVDNNVNERSENQSLSNGYFSCVANLTIICFPLSLDMKLTIPIWSLTLSFIDVIDYCSVTK